MPLTPDPALDALPVDLDATYPDDPHNPARKLHQQHHDKLDEQYNPWRGITPADVDAEIATKADAVVTAAALADKADAAATTAALAGKVQVLAEDTPDMFRPMSDITSSREIFGIDAADSRLFFKSGSTMYQSSDAGVTISTGKGFPANVTTGSTVKKIVRFGNYLWLIGQDSTDARYKLWRAAPAAGNTAFTWEGPLLALGTGATAIGTGLNADASYLYSADYGDPVGGPTVKRISLANANGAGTNWTTVKAADATLRHYHAIAPDPYNAGHVYLTAGDGTGKYLQRSTDYGTTWATIVNATHWQGVQISFTPEFVWVAADSGRGTVYVLDRTDLVPKWASKNYHAKIAVPSKVGSKTWDPASVADGAQVNTTCTLTGAVLGDLVVASFSLAVPAGCQLTANVTAADTVTVTLFNHSGGVVDLASGTLKVSTVGDEFYRSAFYGAADPATGVYYTVAHDTSSGGSRYGLFYLPHVGGELELLEVFGAGVNGEVFIFGSSFYTHGKYKALVAMSTP